jgi:hypothetical protein
MPGNLASAASEVPHGADLADHHVLRRGPDVCILDRPRRALGLLGLPASHRRRRQHPQRGPSLFRLAPPGTKVPMSEATAARAVISKCNEGPGTRVLVAGLVTGPVTSGSPIYWAVFVDPPGRHVAPYAEPVHKPQILNWIGAFVSVKTTQNPFCDFGRAADLPPLPVFADSRSSHKPSGMGARRAGTGARQGQSISSRTAANAVAAVWRSSRLWAADTWTLIRAWPAGTTG